MTACVDQFRRGRDGAQCKGGIVFSKQFAYVIAQRPSSWSSLSDRERLSTSTSTGARFRSFPSASPCLAGVLPTVVGLLAATLGEGAAGFFAARYSNACPAQSPVPARACPMSLPLHATNPSTSLHLEVGGRPPKARSRPPQTVCVQALGTLIGPRIAYEL